MKKSYTFTWIGIVICLLGLSPVSYAQAIEITDSAPFFENFNEIKGAAFFNASDQSKTGPFFRFVPSSETDFPLPVQNYVRHKRFAVQNLMFAIAGPPS